MESTKEKVPPPVCEAQSKGHHVCECYGHTQELPDYRKITVPRTLQGFHAKEGGGCPCIPKTAVRPSNALYCSTNPATCDRVKPSETYRAYEPGRHKVHRADETAGATAAVRDPVTGDRLAFPNSRNYGGTATQRGFPTIGGPKRKTQEERKYEQMQDRKEFLKAVLRDEMRDRIDAEEQLQSIEHELGLRGSRHAQMLAAAASRETPKVDSDYDSKTVAEQYDEVMEELRYVTQQPVGSKLNIIRMHYLLEEQDRLQHLRDQEKKQAAGLTTTKKCST